MTPRIPPVGRPQKHPNRLFRGQYLISGPLCLPKTGDIPSRRLKGSFSVHKHSLRPPGPRPAQDGFTLLELVFVVAIVAVLAAIALPNYADYVKRGRIIEATTALSDARQRTEQQF